MFLVFIYDLKMFLVYFLLKYKIQITTIKQLEKDSFIYIYIIDKNNWDKLKVKKVGT